MSFLIDPPLLFLSGLAIYFLGRRLEWSRHAKIANGNSHCHDIHSLQRAAMRRCRTLPVSVLLMDEGL